MLGEQRVYLTWEKPVQVESKCVQLEDGALRFEEAKMGIEEIPRIFETPTSAVKGLIKFLYGKEINLDAAIVLLEHENLTELVEFALALNS